MPVCVPITELRNTNKFSELVKNANQPVTVTKNGYAEFVVIDAKYFDKYLSKNAESDLQKVIKEMEKDRKEKQYIDAREFLTAIEKKFEL